MNVIPDILFRGDFFGNSTKPERYRNSGLLTKQMNSGDPAYIEKNGLLRSIEEHIAPIDKNNFYNKSCYLSFSSERQISEYYCSYGKIEELKKCEDHTETHYIFVMHIDKCQLIKRDDLNGIYSFTYDCNVNLKSPDSPNPLDLSAQKKECEFCLESKTKKHSFILINAVQYLETNKHLCKDDNSLSNAKRDFEWLVFPTDYLYSSKGYASRIPRSDFWNIEHYYLKSEGKRDRNKLFEISGVIFE